MGRRAIVVLLALAACGDDLAAADTDGGTTTDIGTTGSETLGASGATGTVGDASSSTEASTTSMDPTDATEESSGGAETSGGPVACVTANDCDPGSCELATCEDGVCVYEDDPDEACAAEPWMLAFRDSYQEMFRLDPETGHLASVQDVDVAGFEGTPLRWVTFDPEDGRFIANRLEAMDPVSGPARRIAFVPYAVYAKAYNPETGELWVVTDDGVSVIDIETGLSTPVVQPTMPGPKGPEPVMFQAIAFGDDGAFYGLHPSGGLYSVDLLTGALTLVVALAEDVDRLANGPGESVLYAASDESEQLLRVDLAMGTATPVDVPGLPPTKELAYDAEMETLYGFSSGPQDSSTYSYTIDPVGGSWAFGRRFAISRIEAMAHDDDDDRMLVATEDEDLFVVDVDAQTFDFVGHLDVSRVEAMTFLPDSDTLYMVDHGSFASGSRLISVDPDTAETQATLASLDYGYWGDIAYDPASARLFSAYSLNGDPLNKALWTIDPATGVSSSLGTSNAVSGLAYVAETGLLYGLDAERRIVSLDPASGSPDATVVGPAGATAYYSAFTAVDGVVTTAAFGGHRITFDLDAGRARFDGVPLSASMGSYDPLSGGVYLLGAGFDTNLYRYDPATNTTDAVVYDVPSIAIGDFAIDSTGVGYVFSISDFSQLDLETGVLTPIASGGTFVDCAAFDDEDVLFVVEQDELLTVDTATGARTLVGTLQHPVQELQWDGAAGRLIGFGGESLPYQYIEIDRETAATTILNDEIVLSGYSTSLFVPR